MKPHAVKQTAPTPFYYGWVILFMGALSVFFSGPGQTHSISVFIDYYITDFGWSRSLVSAIYMAATLASGSLLFLVGKLIERFGARTMSVTVSLLLGLACVWNSFLIGPVMLFIGFFTLRLFGQGSMMLIPNTLTPQWFVKQRGRAYSVLGIGGFLGFLLFPPLNHWMIGTWGWPATWRFWALLLIVGFAPLAFLLIRNRPEDMGLLPDSPSARRKEAIDNKPASRVNITEVDWTVKEAMRTRAFWCFLFCTAVPAMVNTGIIFHIYSIYTEAGLPATTASLSLSLIALFSFPFTFVAGFLNERVPVHYVITGIFVGQVIVMVLLAYTDSIAMALAFSILRGIVQGFEQVSMNLVWPNYYGKKAVGSIQGLAMSVMVVASAFGPLPIGMAFDWFGGYQEIIWALLVFPLVAIVAAFISPPPKKQV